MERPGALAGPFVFCNEIATLASNRCRNALEKLEELDELLGQRKVSGDRSRFEDDHFWSY